MTDRSGIIKFKGNAMTLAGNPVKVGDDAPNFTVLGEGLKPVQLSDFKGEVVLVNVVPSLDTPVCELQTRRFNQDVSCMGAKVLTVSMDLPFAQKRFCESFKIESSICASDYKDREFGANYGLTIKELGLLTRAVLVVGRDGKIAYMEIVPEVTDHPDYDAALAAATKAVEG